MGDPPHLQYFDMVCNDLIKVKRFLTSFTIHGSTDTCSPSTKMTGHSIYSQGYSNLLFQLAENIATPYIMMLISFDYCAKSLSANFFTIHGE